MDLNCPNFWLIKVARWLIKVAHRFIHRRRSKELIVISPSPTEKQSKTKFGFFDKQVAHKKLTRSDESVRIGKHNALAEARILSTKVINSIDDFLPEKNEYKNFDRSRRQSRNFDVEEEIKEWSIPYKDLHFEKPLRVGQNGTIYKGYWYGEVLIHTFKDTNNADVNYFWDILAQLCMVRHENIVLFMGACVDSLNLSVITSMRKGPSLLEHIHVKHQVISPPNRINIARQIAQAMGYLHSKGIIHKRLTSNNIILESKVKICLIDQGSIHSYNGSDYGAVTRGYLSYLCPQLMRSIKVEPPLVKYDGRFGPESDVYAFGTVLFELMTGKFPYQRHQSHSIIWLIGNGHHESVLHIKSSNVIRNIVASCWSPLSEQRPVFSQIVKQFQENISLKKHSCSEPARINNIG